jgi:hypothetical protein
MTEFMSLESGKLTNKDITVMAVYELGGALHFVHLEDVAMRAAELAPRRFRWKKYPEQINLESVRISLKDELGSSQCRVLGGIKYGWMLTPNGISWSINANRIRNGTNLIAQINREVEQARKTVAFQKALFNKARDVTSTEIGQFLRVDSYFTVRNRIERVAALNNAAVIDSQLHSVLDSLKRCGFAELEVVNERINPSN